MNTYIHPNKEEEQMMDRVAIPLGASHRVHEKFMKAIHKKPLKRVVNISVVVFSGAFAVVVFMMAMQPSTSFITQAIAASRAKVEMMQEGDVRHMVTVMSPDPFSSMHYDDIRDSTLSDEWWLSSDASSYAFTFHRNDDQYSERKIILDGKEYVTQEKYDLYRAEMQSASTNSVEAKDEDVQTDAQGDEGLSVLGEGAVLEMRIQNLLGFGVQRNVVPNITGALEELAMSSLVQDLGEQKRDDLGKVYVYSLSYLDERDPVNVITQGIDYVFDTDTKELKEIDHWTQVNDEAPQESSITKIVIDEVVSLKSLATNPFDPSAHGLVAMAEGGASDSLVTSSALMINPYEIQNFRCTRDCQNLIVTDNQSPLFSDSTCSSCDEILLWTGMNVEKDAITLMGEMTLQGKFVSLPDQILLLSDYPNWVGRAFPMRIDGTDTVLNLMLRQANEENLIADVKCSSGCENIKVGVQRDSGINELLIDTCQPKSCDTFSIISTPIMDETNRSEDGLWIEDNHWKGGYSVSVWKISSLFAFNDDHGEEIVRVEYSPDQTVTGKTLYFHQVVDGHELAFDLMSTWP